MSPKVDKRLSWSPNRLPKPRPSKFKRLKQRLQMKPPAPDEPIDPQLEDDIEEDDAIPPQLDDQAPRSEAIEGNRNNAVLFNRASPMKIFRVCKGFTPDQCKVIVNAHLGDVLEWKVSKLIPELCKFLMGCFNPETCKLDFGARGSIPIDMQSVVSVMGVPMGSTPFSYCMDPKATRKMLDLFGIKEGKQPSLAWLEKELGPAHPADQIFLMKFCIYLTCAVIAPTTAIGISPRCYQTLLKTDAIHSLNWAKFIIDIMIRTARAKCNKNWFKACMPYLMVRYVDSLETDAIHVPEDGTRICIWTNQLVKLAVDLDTNTDGSFGKLPLKACFRNKMTLFSAGPSALDMFIKAHAPGDLTQDVLAKYRVAVTEMCNVFEDGLAQFLKNLGSKDTKAPIEEEQHVQNNRGRRRSDRNIRKVEVDGLNGEGNDVPAVQPKGSRKRFSVEENVSTASGSGKKQKTDHKEQSEPLETVENNLQQKMEGQSSPRDVDTFELDLEIATSKAAAIRTSLSNAKDRNDNKEEANVGGVIPLIDSLKHLQIYGTSSQSSADSTTKDGSNNEEQPKLTASETVLRDASNVVPRDKQISPGCKTPKAGSEPNIHPVQPKSSMRTPKKSVDSKAKHVSFANAQESPTGRRPVTRSMSPLKPPSPCVKESPTWDVGSSGIPNICTQRPARVATAKIRAGRTNQSENTADAQQCMQSTPPLEVSTSRKLDLGSVSTESLPETEEQRRWRQLQELIEDCPSFDLGFDDSPVPPVTTEQPAACKEETVVISSNESGDSWDAIFPKIDMPAATATPAIAKPQAVPLCSPTVPNSSTPLPNQAHQRRIVKTGPNQKSPYLQTGKKIVALRSTSEVYSKLCTFGGRTEDAINKEKIIDYGEGDWFIYVRDLADSVKPTGWLSNSTCELALSVLSKEMANQRKFVMPLIIGTKLRSLSCIHDRVVKKAFENTPTNRLDHKDMIMFSILQDLSPKKTRNTRKGDLEFTGHYYLITLNLKAERFEVMDSMRSKGNPSLTADALTIVSRIKHLWDLNFSESKINISKWKTEFIDVPKQITSHDCGYIMLMLIERWDGRRLVQALSNDEIPTLRKILMQRWLDRQENLITWHHLLFPQ